MKNVCRKLGKSVLLCLLLAAVLGSVTVLAGEASVTYGSKEYAPVAGEVFNIGVYIRSDAACYVYDVAMQYDPAKLEYLGGADDGGGGTLRFAGECDSGQRKYMLIFRACKEGDCSITVTAASVITNSPADTEPLTGADGQPLPNQTEPVIAQITGPGSAPVRIQAEEEAEDSCRLERMKISYLPDFAWEPDIYEYELEVPGNRDRLHIDAKAGNQDATVEISDTSLETGENTITVTVRSEGEELCYTLHVTRLEPELESPASQEVTAADRTKGDVDGAAGSADGAEGDVDGTAGSADGTEGSVRSEITQESSVAFVPEEEPLAMSAEKEASGVDNKNMVSSAISGKHNLADMLPYTGCVLLLAGVLTAVILIRKRRKRGQTEEEDYLDLDEDWVDLDSDEAWIRWLVESEESATAMEASEEASVVKEEAPAMKQERADAKETQEIKAIKAIENPSEPVQPEAKASAGVALVPMESPVIKVDNVSMRFKISDANAGSLKEYLLAVLKGQNRYHELLALDRISLQIQKGEVVGIVGTNGSGKSTLLKLIAGALEPSDGRIEVDHKNVQLLTLGTGFDTELTARENIYLNGAIIGYTREFINANYDAIVEFAELEGFMDEKIKNFSSGMVSRLGFSIATVGVTPEILILDEVLSVGDMFFRKKSEKRIREMIHSGSTVLIVSHSTDTILKNCTKAVWIEKGILKEMGEPKKVCAAYRKQAG